MGDEDAGNGQLAVPDPVIQRLNVFAQTFKAITPHIILVVAIA
jgi:hypothetical protein